MAKTGLVQFDPARDSVRSFLAQIDELGTDRRRLENSIMRGLSKQAAERVRPLVERAVRSSPAPQAAKVAATARAKSDRMIVVTVGSVNPQLSGMRRSSRNKQWRGSLAWGVALGGWSAQSQQVDAHRRRRTKRRAGGPVSGSQRTQGNVYRAGRSGSPPDPFSGYLRGYREQVVDQAAEEYADIILEMAARNGWKVT